MKKAHPKMKDSQKLLRNLMVLEMIVHILKNYKPEPVTEYGYIATCGLYVN